MTYYAIGLMSGTSLDGLDICYAQFTELNNKWNFKIIHAKTLAYATYWEEQLKNSIDLSAEQIFALHSEYGYYLGEKVNQFITDHQIEKLDLIASHGHTVFHQPGKNFTVQIGDGRAIHSITQHKTIYDFRSQDVILGGNGAPLVPIGDLLLFSDYQACLNLGGFSNISFDQNKKRIAFDICPVNIILNPLAEKRGKKYDQNGTIARSGNIDLQLLEQLNTLAYYQQSAPKSLGIEWVIQNIHPLITNQKTEDLLATFTEHAAQQLAKTIHQHQLSSVLITGGGAYNNFLIERLSAQTTAEIIIPNPEIIDYKEALIFAFMGVLKSLGRTNILSSVTGSQKDHSSGLIID